MIAAIVPAAGRSLRMGQPKLLLELDGQTVIFRVVTALLAGGAERVVVVAPPADSPEGPALASESARGGAEVVVPPTRPAEMRESIERALDVLVQGPQPRLVLLTPGDSPGISPVLVARLLESAARSPGNLVIPRHGSRRGHPIALPWDVAAEIRTLPAGLGVNALVARQAARIVEVVVADPNAVADLDTPEDLRQWSLQRPPGERHDEDSISRNS
jgi:molybdenum cofactor cytidylyltransferase